MENELKSLFFQGSYKKVLALSLENENQTAESLRSHFPWVVGALCFTGRKEEAESLFTQLQKTADPTSIAAGCFFLGVAFCRHGHYRKALGFFAKNIRAHRKASGDLAFYAWQGLAFYHYFCSRFRRSEKAALRSLTEASVSQMTYGRALALDIMGHALVQQGLISAGLNRLTDAKKTADRLGNGGLSNSIEISILVYEAQYGLSPNRILADLKSARRRLDPQNSYAQANLLLEMANQNLLRGRIHDASAALNEASTLIYGTQHRRYSYLLALRFAEVAYRQGELALALHTVQMQRPFLDEKYDRVNLLIALGMEIKILKALKMEAQAKTLAGTLSALTSNTERSIAKNIEARTNSKSSPQADEDQVAQFLSGLGESVSIHKVLRAAYKSFAYEALDLPMGSSWIVSRRNDLLILDRGSVTHRRVRVPDQLLRLMSALSSGSKSKEKLVQELWGYAYHPLYHDPLLYQAVTRLRELLGSSSELIEISEEGYRLKRGFGFIFIQDSGVAQPLAKRLSLPPERQKIVEGENFSLELNLRQIRLLELLKKKDFLGVRECLKRFEVSDMTLKRDFSGLVKGGWVQRIGRGRATRYTLQNHLPSVNLPPQARGSS